ncbi:MAG: tRNA-dihydrouridine synthase [Anaerovoracaceae bacterium]
MKNANIMGIDINNPIIISPGPWSRGKMLKDALECNAGAIITESVVSESYPDTRPRYAYNQESKGLQNIRLYSALELEDWIYCLKEANNAKRYMSDSKLIVSIMGSTPSELRYIARKVEQTGIDGIEIGLSCPMGEGPEIIAGDTKRVYEYTKEVVNAVSIPVSVKLGAFTNNLAATVHAIEKAGASGISAIDTLRAILNINTETGKPSLPTYGGYSGAPIRPVGLATVAGIAQSTNLPVIGMGGIENYKNVLEYIMLGSKACGIGTEILLRGYSVVTNTIKDLNSWFKSHKINDIEQIRGISLKELRSFEEIKLEIKQAKLSDSCTDSNCKKCLMCCLKNAISMDSGCIDIDSSICDGCGLCINICPENKIHLTWT